MKINIAAGTTAALPMIYTLYQKNWLNELHISKALLPLENQLRNRLEGVQIESYYKEEKEAIDLNKDPDLLLVFDFHYSIQRIQGKTFKIHLGELPEYRGSEPLFWALKNGEKIAYVTIHELTDKGDSGSIYSQKGYPILPSENEGLLRSRLGNSIIPQVERFIENKGEAREQNEEDARQFSQPGNLDLMIDWYKMTAYDIQNLINACNPNYIGARTSFNGTSIQLVEAYAHPEFTLNEEQISKKPGHVIMANQQGLAVLTVDKKPLFISVAHMNEGTFSALKLMQLGVNEETVFG